MSKCPMMIYNITSHRTEAEARGSGRYSYILHKGLKILDISICFQCQILCYNLYCKDPGQLRAATEEDGSDEVADTVVNTDQQITEMTRTFTFSIIIHKETCFHCELINAIFAIIICQVGLIWCHRHQSWVCGNNGLTSSGQKNLFLRRWRWNGQWAFNSDLVLISEDASKIIIYSSFFSHDLQLGAAIFVCIYRQLQWKSLSIPTLFYTCSG